jgi:hypothetical protein
MYHATSMSLINQAILAERTAAYDARTTPSLGDYVLFADGFYKRIAQCYRGGKIQTTDGGSFYLGLNNGSYSGSLDRPIVTDDFELMPERKRGRFWFFSHDEWRAHNGVEAELDCRVWRSGLESPRF